jgi:tRNA(Arg) A34 adenosine deaminase TadA
MMKNKYMIQALKLAKVATGHNDVPVGCIIVNFDGKIIGRGENQVEKNQNPTRHAEIVALEKACKKMQNKFLPNGCVAYITLEPCAMCATALSFARVSKIIFAADDVKGGAISGNSRIFETDRHLWQPEIVQDSEFAELSAQMLKDFFKNIRKSKY